MLSLSCFVRIIVRDRTSAAREWGRSSEWINNQSNFMTNKHELDGMRVAIIVTDNFEEEEMTDPRKALDEAGAETVLIAPKKDAVRAIQHDKPGQTFPVDEVLEDANPDRF